MSQARTVTATFSAATSNGPVVAYSFDAGSGSSVADVSGNGRTGTIRGATWAPGKYGSALSFDGTNDYVNTAYTTNLARWTISLWVKSPAAPTSGSSSGPVHREKNFQINWNHPSSTFRGAAGVQVRGTWYAASFGALAANTWYHLAATYDGETLRTYRDGVLIGRNTAPSGNPDTESMTLKLGRHAAAAQYFKGSVDDVRIYNRVLSQTEIQGDMNTPLH
jgi:hypothetical protein